MTKKYEKFNTISELMMYSQTKPLWCENGDHEPQKRTVLGLGTRKIFYRDQDGLEMLVDHDTALKMWMKEVPVKVRYACVDHYGIFHSWRECLNPKIHEDKNNLKFTFDELSGELLDVEIVKCK